MTFDPSRPEAVRRWLLQLSETAVAAVHPDALVFDNLPSPPAGRTLVIGAGKAAAAMAAALERAWKANHPDAPLSGLVVTRYGHGRQEPGRQEKDRHKWGVQQNDGPQPGNDGHCIEVLEAAHPMPDDLSERAARRMLESLEGLGEDDLVIALISGGGSALMTLPAPGVALEEKQALNKTLLRCGAPISEINTVRRHLSAIKGGRLAAAAHPARVLTWLISDVPGDQASLIASGPTLPDASTPADALAILKRYAIDVSPSVRHHLATATDAPREDEAAFRDDRHLVLARARDAQSAACHAAEAEGIEVRLLGDDLEGEARELGRDQAQMALDAQTERQRPLLLLSGGETSVTMQGDGRGGRNVEYLLGLFAALGGAPDIYAIAIDTDGIDGSEDNAGAVFGPACWALREKLGLDPDDYLSRNDAYTFFAALDDLIVTGPTRTNVNDFRAILVLPRTS